MPCCRNFAETACCATPSSRQQCLDTLARAARCAGCRYEIRIDRFPGALKFQVEMIRSCLAMLAEHQAKWFGEGWRIVYTEQAPQNSMLNVDDADKERGGRIDRIDYQRRLADLGGAGLHSRDRREDAGKDASDRRWKWCGPAIAALPAPGTRSDCRSGSETSSMSSSPTATIAADIHIARWDDADAEGRCRRNSRGKVVRDVRQLQFRGAGASGRQLTESSPISSARAC